MSIRISKILMFLAQISAGSLVGVASKYLISKPDKNLNLSQESLFSKIENLFSQISKSIDDSLIKKIMLEFKYTLPGTTHKIFKNGSKLLEELTNWFNYWLVEQDIYFSTSVKENKNSSSYEIFCSHNSKKYKFSFLFSNKDKSNYEVLFVFLLGTIEPLIKQLNELIFNYYQE